VVVTVTRSPVNRTTVWLLDPAGADSTPDPDGGDPAAAGVVGVARSAPPVTNTAPAAILARTRRPRNMGLLPF
jgi:hypothetical protein